MSAESSRGPVVIAGGSGFLGLSLATHLTSLGWPVVLLARHTPPIYGPWRFVPWDARGPGPWQRELDGARALVNLAGRSVDCRKTPDQVDEILRSRVEATRALGVALRHVSSPPPVWVQMSTAHAYGDPPQAVCDEDSAFGYGLAPTVARAWEQAFQAGRLPQQRGVVLRTSFVIGRDRGAGSGALRRLRWLAQLGLGGRVGSGQQGFSWIHEADLNRLFERAISTPAMSGAYLATAPRPVSQALFMRTLRQVLRMPIGLPTPAWLARFGAACLLRTDPELALYGRYVVSRRLREEQFDFQFPDLKSALENLLRPENIRTVPAATAAPTRVAAA